MQEEIQKEMENLIKDLENYSEATQKQMKNFLNERLNYENFGADIIEYGETFASMLNKKVQEGVKDLKEISDPSNPNYETELNKLKSYIKHSLDFVAIKTKLSEDELKRHEDLKQKIDRINGSDLSFFDMVGQFIKNFFSNLKSTDKKPISNLKVSKNLDDILNYSQKAKIQRRFERE